MSMNYGRIQTLLRESVKLLNFGKVFWSCDSACKLTPRQRFSACFIQPVLWNRRNCPQSSRWEKYRKDGENSKNFSTIGMSVKKCMYVPKFIQIGPIILVENVCWSSAIWKIRNHKLSFYNFVYILILELIFLIQLNDMVPDFLYSWTSACFFH